MTSPRVLKLRPEHVWLLLVALVVLMVVLFCIHVVLGVHQRASSTLSQIDARYARIAGLLQDQGQIALATQQIDASQAQFLYPAGGDFVQIGNDVLQKVRDLAQSHDLHVTSSQSQPDKPDEDHSGIEKILINLRIEGEWDGMQAFFADLTKQKPAIYMGTVILNTQYGGRYYNNSGNNMPVTISGQFDLYVLAQGTVAAPTQIQTNRTNSAPSGSTQATTRSGNLPPGGRL